MSWSGIIGGGSAASVAFSGSFDLPQRARKSMAEVGARWIGRHDGLAFKSIDLHAPRRILMADLVIPVPVTQNSAYWTFSSRTCGAGRCGGAGSQSSSHRFFAISLPLPPALARTPVAPPTQVPRIRASRWAARRQSHSRRTRAPEARSAWEQGAQGPGLGRGRAVMRGLRRSCEVAPLR